MSPAELKTKREALGLSQQWLANRVGVRIRTIQRWEAGDQTPPNDVQDEILKVEMLKKNEVSRILVKARTQKETPTLLFRYKTEEELWIHSPTFHSLPVTTYALVVLEAKKRIEKEALKCDIDYF